LVINWLGTGALQRPGSTWSDATRIEQLGQGDVLEHAEDTDRGARIGGAAGLILAGIVSVGAFAVVGPLAALLVGVSGGIGGSLVGALIGSGMPETHAHAVSARLQGRGILIAVSVPEAQEKLVRKILTETGGNFVDSD
jgi:hypothetical protein